MDTLKSNKTIGVISAGAWGTALAQTLCDGGNNVQIWARESDVVKTINDTHENTRFLPNVPLNKNLTATDDLSAIAKRDILLIVTPAQHVRATLKDLKPLVSKDTPLVICSKGIELGTGLLLSQVAEQETPDNPIGVLTGPSFASEIAKGLPSAVTIATQSEKLSRELQSAIGVRNFRPYVTSDMIGTQLGGAIKNVIAIACGIVTGKGMGESARAALLTRGVAEIGRLGVAMGAKRETLLGMCGIGDLMLTCSSTQSRNFSLGLALGQGEALEDIMKKRTAVTEGIYTAEATLKLAKRNAVDMPISESIHKMLSGESYIDEAIEDMLNRPFRYVMKGKERRSD